MPLASCLPGDRNICDGSWCLCKTPTSDKQVGVAVSELTIPFYPAGRSPNGEGDSVGHAGQLGYSGPVGLAADIQHCGCQHLLYLGASLSSPCWGIGPLSEAALPSWKEQAGDPKLEGLGSQENRTNAISLTPVVIPTEAPFCPRKVVSLVSFLLLGLSLQHFCPLYVPATQQPSSKSLCGLK